MIILSKENPNSDTQVESEAQLLEEKLRNLIEGWEIKKVTVRTVDVDDLNY